MSPKSTYRFPKQEIKSTMLSVDYMPKRRKPYDDHRNFDIITNAQSPLKRDSKDMNKDEVIR